MPEKQHDLNSPSQLYKRYMCPGSAKAEEPFYPKGPVDPNYKKADENEAAREGTLKHDTVHSLNLGQPITVQLEKEAMDQVNFCYRRTQELLAQFCEEHKAAPDDVLILYEHELDLNHIGISGGTADVIFVLPGVAAMLIDYKFGFMIVDHPKWNLQFKAYALGIVKKFGCKTVECVKMQPTLDSEDIVQAYTFKEDEFMPITGEIALILAKTEAVDAPLVPGAKQCTYCKAKDTCGARKEIVGGLPMHMDIPNFMASISPVDRASFFERLEVASKWIKDAQDKMTAMVVEQKIVVDGYEARPGKIMQKWAVNDLTLAARLRGIALDKGIDPNLFECHEIVSVSQAKIIIGKGKKTDELLSPLVLMVPSELKLKKKAKE